MIEVVAKKIDNKHIYYECPYCYRLKSGRKTDKPYNEKNKKIYLSAKPTIHKHGSCGNLQNRIETRGTHCNFSKGDIRIVINDITEKIGNNNFFN